MYFTEESNFPVDKEEVKDLYQDVIESCLDVNDTIECYNTLLSVAQLIAEDLGYDLELPFAKIAEVVH